MKSLIDPGKKIVIKVLLGIGLVSMIAGQGLSQSLGHLSSSGALSLFSGGSQGLPDFVILAKKLRPMVVNISATQVGERLQGVPNPFQEDDSLEEFFGDPSLRGRPFRQLSLGSGFIVDRDGSILTNSHVVEKAEEIVVKLADEREFPAKVVGKDSKTDIAVIRIDAKGNLPVAPLGNSDKLEVGEWVMAIGNPFGLDSSVTSGIVSAKDRHIGAGPYDNFIQTDTPVNPGNSGGPLINMRGEVVGINAAIVSQTGGNIGIGFATPINLVKELLPQLKEKGRVSRGWLGITVQRVTPKIVDSLGVDRARGALVAGVSSDGPADRGGIKVGDVIVKFDGKEVKEPNDLSMMVARTAVDKKVQVKVLREKKEVALTATIRLQKEEG